MQGLNDIFCTIVLIYGDIQIILPYTDSWNLKSLKLFANAIQAGYNIFQAK